MKVDEVRGICKARSKWKEAISERMKKKKKNEAPMRIGRDKKYVYIHSLFPTLIPK
jgi:hypothetical protein